jgi:hypothetical protein
VPTLRKFSDSGYVSGGLPFAGLLTSTALFGKALKIVSAGADLADEMEPPMNLTNIGLCLILVAMIALIPCGCIMTRPRKNDAPESPVVSPASTVIEE